MTTINQKVNAINVTLTDFAKAERAKSDTASKQFEQTSDDDYKRAMQKAATKDNYVTAFLAKTSDAALKQCAKLFALDAVVDVLSDSYSVVKLRALCEALAANDKSKLSADNQLETFAVQFVTANDEQHLNHYRAECKSARQLQMCFKLFERLDIVRREKRESRAFDYAVKLDTKQRKAVEALFE